MLGADEIAQWLDDLLDATRYRPDEPESGLIFDSGRPVQRIASAVNTTFESIAGAAVLSADLLLVHHPSWSHSDLELHPRKLTALAASGISLYGAHASLDAAVEHGTGHELARLLGVGVEGRFGPYAGSQAGVYGALGGGWDALVARVAETVGVAPEVHRNTDRCERIAILTGAGGLTSWLEEARALECDTYITGEGSMYTRLYAREAGLNLILAGHDLTEAPGIHSLADRAAQHFGLPQRSAFVPRDPDETYSMRFSLIRQARNVTTWTVPPSATRRSPVLSARCG